MADQPEHRGQHGGHCGKCNAWRYDHPEDRRKQDTAGTPRHSSQSPEHEIGFGDLAEAAVAILAMERGGSLSIPRPRTEAALEKMKERFPKGVHMHFDNRYGDIEIAITDATKCTRSQASHGEDDDTVDWQDGKVTVGQDGSYYEPGLAGERIDPNKMSKADLWKINHAQHILLVTALERLGAPLTVSFDEFQKASAASPMGQSALSISKSGDEFHAAIISVTKEGRA